mmetsp:Transcript_66354/g.176650  ORF Transcript_66354/g.176650 Transcript_66354/m.176650 type:complete len:233 (-) Transcript_66354:254-952(-)
MRPRRTNRSRRDHGPPPGPAQPNWSRLGPTRGSPGLQSRAHCQTRQPSDMRATGEVALRARTCRRWRPTRSTHATSAGARAGSVAGAHNTRAAAVEGRNGPSQPPTALPRRPTRRAVAVTHRHQTLTGGAWAVGGEAGGGAGGVGSEAGEVGRRGAAEATSTSYGCSCPRGGRHATTADDSSNPLTALATPRMRPDSGERRKLLSPPVSGSTVSRNRPHADSPSERAPRGGW